MTVPRTKNFLDDKNGRETFKNELNDVFEIRSNYVHYKPSNNVAEMRMELKWAENR